jgi:hypothetical protein
LSVPGESWASQSSVPSVGRGIVLTPESFYGVSPKRLPIGIAGLTAVYFEATGGRAFGTSVVPIHGDAGAA